MGKGTCEEYLGKTFNQFVLHGNIRDKVMLGGVRNPTFISLKSFLSDELFASRDIIMFYDRSPGVQFNDKNGMADFKRAVTGDVISSKQSVDLPRDPQRIFPLLEQYFLLRRSQNKSIACIIDFAETIVPADFIPPSYPDEMELQILAAVIECTSYSLLPAKYKKMDRDQIASRFEELKILG
ncbi:MAG: hypothetical protein WD267_01335 [Balneolales bacterium]